MKRSEAPAPFTTYIFLSTYIEEDKRLGDVLICERCSSQDYTLEKCNYCSKFVCESCKKSAKRVKKVDRYVICKDCWGKLKLRSKFKAL